MSPLMTPILETERIHQLMSQFLTSPIMIIQAVYVLLLQPTNVRGGNHAVPVRINVVADSCRRHLLGMEHVEGRGTDGDVGMMLHQTPPCTCPVLLLSCFPSPQVRYCYTIYHNNHRTNPEVKKIGHSFPSLCSYLIRYTPGYLIRYHCQHFVLNAQSKSEVFSFECNSHTHTHKHCVGILLTCRKHLHVRIISLKGDFGP